MLGSGTFANVYEGKNVRTGEVVAVKWIKKGAYEEDIHGEHKINKIVRRWVSVRDNIGRHPNIIMFLDEYIDPSTKRPCFVFEFAKCGSVRSYLLAHSHYSEAVVMEIIRSIIHRDVKPRNILLRAREPKNNSDVFPWVPALGDLGLSSRLKSDGTVKFLGAGTMKYCPPEAFNTNKIGRKGDIWATGITLYEMLCGCVPWFQTKPKKVLADEINRRDFDFSQTRYENISSDARDLLGDLLKKELDDRPSVDMVLKNYQWFQTASREKTLSNRVFCNMHDPDASTIDLVQVARRNIKRDSHVPGNRTKKQSEVRTRE
ncbi:kinase-like protein [Fomitiporia mediterranea MF3/22]|uniref:kinase-like protein n=1 Tax=Fomitiporia mediterranea (strain MF3/22) TaxID=694068 RepID=UPI0004408F5C|nr:kinase-like protein [Fomitiporia mediterranea MF3/22]EJD04652.1 kinase-like protein [Fomitiporia mediterranea MF3/22]